MNAEYIVNVDSKRVEKVSECDPDMINLMLMSGSWRYATEEDAEVMEI